MTRKRKRHRGELKAKVALEAIREQQPAVRLAGNYGVDPERVNQWERHLLAHLAEVFAPDTL